MNSERAFAIPRNWEKSHKPRSLTAKDWEAQRETFERLYVAENLELNEVRWIMAESYGFFANQRQSKAAIKRWNLRKTLGKAKAMKMLRIKNTRKAERKDTKFVFHGKPVSGQNLERARKRFEEKDGDKELVSPAATPSHVDYWTPKSLASSPVDHSPEIGEDTSTPRASTPINDSTSDADVIFPTVSTSHDSGTEENTEMGGNTPRPSTPTGGSAANSTSSIASTSSHHDAGTRRASRRKIIRRVLTPR